MVSNLFQSVFFMYMNALTINSHNIVLFTTTTTKNTNKKGKKNRF